MNFDLNISFSTVGFTFHIKCTATATYINP